MARFFYIIYKTILFLLFTNKSCNKKLLKLILTYFKIVKTNNYGIFHLHCLVKITIRSTNFKF